MPKIINNGITYCGLNNDPISNPNLIINGDFRVNQRGQSTYSHVSSSGWYKITYTVDRWCLHGNPNSTVVVNEDKTLTLKPNSIGEYYFNQYLEEALPLGDYTLTVKVLSLSGNADCHINGSAKSLKVGINTYTLNGSVDNVGVMVYGNSSMTIEYIKLEQGTVATPFVPRLIGEELMLCMRYYTPATGTRVGKSDGDSSTSYFNGIYFPVPMRVAPTCTIDNDVTAVDVTERGVSYFKASGNHSAIIISGTMDAEIYPVF